MAEKKAGFLTRTIDRLRGRSSVPPETLDAGLRSETWRPRFDAWCVQNRVELERMLAFMADADDFRGSPSWPACHQIMRYYLNADALMPIGIDDGRRAALDSAIASGQGQPPSPMLFDSTRDTVYKTLEMKYAEFRVGPG